MPRYVVVLITFFILTLTALFVVRPQAIESFETESENYHIQMGNLNFTSLNKSSSSYALVDTGGEFAPSETTSTNYVVKAGFQYVATIIPFTFTISNKSVAFGTLSPDTPATNTTNLTVTSGAAYGYQVTAQANNQLKHTVYGSVFIDDVTGDNTDITHTQEGDWALSTTYGFGYGLSDITGSDAVFNSGFRAFSDQSNSESPVAVMSNTGVTKESEVQVTYKANISGVQESGSYENTTTYAAIASF